MGRGGDSTLELEALSRTGEVEAYLPRLPEGFRTTVRAATLEGPGRVVAFDSTQQIGVLSVEGNLVIETIEVLPEYQRRGVATAMMDAYEDTTGDRPRHSWEGLTAAGEAWAQADDPEGWDEFREQFDTENRCPSCQSLALYDQPDGSVLCGGCGNWIHHMPVPA